MRRRIITCLLGGIVGSLLILSAFALGRADAAVPTGSAANQASSWVTHLLNDKGVEAQCFKHAGTGQNDHGYVLGKAVILAPFNQAWFGDHWALLVVKGGNGNTVVYNPTAGVPYFAPLNGGGNVPDVSHWIVCKGVTPEQPPTTTRPEEPPTTTTPPEEPPTTVPVEPPTTTVPVEPPTTTTPPVAPPTTIVEPPATTTPEVAVTITAAPAVIEQLQPTVLAFTGAHTTLFIIVAMWALVAGVLLLAWRRALA